MLSPISFFRKKAPDPVVQDSPWSSGLQKDVMGLIFRKLAPKELLLAGGVCKYWREIASSDVLWRLFTLKEAFPNAPVVDESFWDAYVDLEKHKLVFQQNVRPCLENKSHFLDLCRLESKVENEEGFSIVTLPAKLTIDKIIAFAKVPKAGQAVHISFLFKRFATKLRNKELPDSITIAISNGVLKNSRGKLWVTKEGRVKKLKCEVPYVISVLTLVAFRKMTKPDDAPIRPFGGRKFGGSEKTITVCNFNETVLRSHLCIDYFNPYFPPSIHLLLWGGEGQAEGVGAQREFPVLKNQPPNN